MTHTCPRANEPGQQRIVRLVDAGGRLVEGSAAGCSVGCVGGALQLHRTGNPPRVWLRRQRCYFAPQWRQHQRQWRRQQHTNGAFARGAQARKLAALPSGTCECRCSGSSDRAALLILAGRRARRAAPAQSGQPVSAVPAGGHGVVARGAAGGASDSATGPVGAARPGEVRRDGGVGGGRGAPFWIANGRQIKKGKSGLWVVRVGQIRFVGGLWF